MIEIAFPVILYQITAHNVGKDNFFQKVIVILPVLIVKFLQLLIVKAYVHNPVRIFHNIIYKVKKNALKIALQV